MPKGCASRPACDACRKHVSIYLSDGLKRQMIEENGYPSERPIYGLINPFVVSLSYFDRETAPWSRCPCSLPQPVLSLCYPKVNIKFENFKAEGRKKKRACPSFLLHQVVQMKNLLRISI